MNNQLKPCPWCDETNKRKILSRSLNGEYRIDHLDAVFRLQSSLIWETEEEAIKEWNKRVS